MKPFAILFKDEDGMMVFKRFETLEEARTKANTIALMGHEVSVFDYDAETDEYLEFFSF